MPKKMMRRWQTRGGKYRIDLFQEDGLYHVEMFANGDKDGMWYNHKDLDRLMAHLNEYISRAARMGISAINYQEVAI